MHLLVAQRETVAEAGEAIDIGQSPGDIVFLSAADTELAGLAAARGRQSEGAPSLRLANVLQLAHPMSVDLYAEKTLANAKLVVVRLLGGAAYWNYGLEALLQLAQTRGVQICALPGDDRPDPSLDRFSTIGGEARAFLWRCLVEGGAENAGKFLDGCAAVIGAGEWPAEAQPLLKAGVFTPSSRPDGRTAVPSSRCRDLLPQGEKKAAPADGTPLSNGAEQGAIPRPLGERVDASDSERTGEGTDASENPTPRPLAAVLFYRALVQSGQTEPIEALCDALAKAGLDALPVYVSSLKDPVSIETVRAVFARRQPAVVINLTGFAVSSPTGARQPTVLEEHGAVVLQAILSSGRREAWEISSQGLSGRDLAMQVALPEVDGRVLSRAIAFKAAGEWDARCEIDIVAHRAVPDRVRFVAELAAAWASLRATPPEERRVALLLANYPNRDGRLGNGVGLDTPAGTIEVMRAMAAAGYRVDSIPATGNALIEELMAGPTNAGVIAREIRETLSLESYRAFFATLPAAVQAAVTDRWGAPEADPFVDPAFGFALPLMRFGHLVVGVQPARGYNIDPKETYHSPDLVPPHNYLALYTFLRREFRMQAVIHMGKHGNLEWLPGKAVALSEACFPEAVLGPVPHLYPFIVNDPGEGSQAKRRASAVIIDHLTPPLTRAESYGPLRDLEALVDEYYQAAGSDPRRVALLTRQILDLMADIGLDADAGISPDEAEDTALEKLDAYLCDLKEMQIRDGLHVFGVAPEGRLLTDLVVALARLPRGMAPGDASLHRALAADLGLASFPETAVPSSALRAPSPPRGEESRQPSDGAETDGIPRPSGERVSASGSERTGEGSATVAHFDPLDCAMAAPWTGPRPQLLHSLSPDPWRSTGDTVERLELLAAGLVSGAIPRDIHWLSTEPVLAEIDARLRPSVTACGRAELAGLLAGLDGRFVAPGPSGAPTRGRPEVLPTGRNFFSVDTRSVPTPAAWTLGQKSAELLVLRHLQDHGDWPRAVGLTAWGTANMRTGGDDIAQALALIGVKPRWDMARVTGFEILSQAVLGRPRVDVTLRISGFFRDAFPDQIALFDRAVRAVGALEEDEGDNPIAARMRNEAAGLVAAGTSPAEAERRAGFRIFGSKPGAYGAGLQALMDEKGWAERADLAEAFLVWGSYAYGADAEGEAERKTFEMRLSGVEAVVQNQDNREHDLLDSDDYYQFEGGMTAAVEHVSGARPAVYHNDHSRPERPVIRTLEEEIGRVVRARVVNPKWIAGVMRHGYKGGFEIAATVDYLFAFAATTGAVRDHHFDAVYQAFVADEAVRDFMLDNNPAAFAEMQDKLAEAVARGLWSPRSNSARIALDVALERTPS
ncbi:cobaltochelatase subunit CobN [Aureimonas glaciei]|uniref:Cobaltochelatase subunit CobN n=1 Tax=Aureimonas glaciei TaxID=1776957 RepID=A0A916XSP0_9HYPH|nr:cobaltochelatase subunit CobN [Aureimonas glaciei]GGD04581.1 cobaltochelatase subunit CobN [Aureimonas glaciei]